MAGLARGLLTLVLGAGVMSCRGFGAFSRPVTRQATSRASE